MKRDLTKEIELNRIRKHDFLNDRVIIHDLQEFESMINSIINKEHDGYSVYQLIPVAICSAFESFFRFNIEDIIDNKKVTLQQVLKIDEVKNFKCGISTIQEMLKSKISLGEVVSKLVTIRNMKNINAILSLLLNCDFLKEVVRFKPNSTQASINLTQTYWAENYSIILKDINAVYEVRNIICHEFSFFINIERSTLLRYLKHGIVFLERVSAILHFFYYKRQVEKRKISEVTLKKRDFLRVEMSLDLLVNKVNEYTTRVWYDTVNLSSNLKEEIFFWKKHRRKIAKSNCWIYMGGRGYYYHYWIEMEAMTKEMINTLNSRYEHLFNEVEKSSKIQQFL